MITQSTLIALITLQRRRRRRQPRHTSLLSTASSKVCDGRRWIWNRCSDDGHVLGSPQLWRDVAAVTVLETTRWDGGVDYIALACGCTAGGARWTVQNVRDVQNTWMASTCVCIVMKGKRDTIAKGTPLHARDLYFLVDRSFASTRARSIRNRKRKKRSFLLHVIRDRVPDGLRDQHQSNWLSKAIC